MVTSRVAAVLDKACVPMARFSEKKPVDPKGQAPITEALYALEHDALFLAPYDSAAQEAWFETARTLLAQVGDERERVAWMTILAEAYIATVANGLPLSLVQARLAKMALAGLLWKVVDLARFPCC
jgi:DNA-binding transcriptional LysR family regulator